MVRMWLDDIRDPRRSSPVDWIWVKSYEEAIELLKTGTVELASLDHDLAKKKTGYDVVCWMEENNIWPSQGVEVHSMNPVGKIKMERVIKKHYFGTGGY